MITHGTIVFINSTFSDGSVVDITTMLGDLKKMAFQEYPNFKTTIQDQISYINSDFEFLLRAHIYSKITQYSK